MPETLEIRGVPTRLRQDAWWFSDAAGIGGPTQSPPPIPPHLSLGDLRPRIRRHPLLLLLALVGLSDWLFWDHPAGVSLALFVLLLSAAILITKTPTARAREWILGMGFATLCVLPVIEYLQVLSVLFALTAPVRLLGWAAHHRLLSVGQNLKLLLRASAFGPLEAGTNAAHIVEQTTTLRPDKDRLKALILPMLCGGAFLSLFAFANPIVEDLLAHLGTLQLPDHTTMARALFWVMLAALLWPYLHSNGAWRGTLAPTRPARERTAYQSLGLVSPASVRNSLYLFNAMFAVQTIMDFGILTGGVGLPHGMAYAEYAHRGAYPLVVTALLAGVFAINTHRHIADQRMLKALMYLWLAQNLILVVTALLRLQLYVDAYGLTYLRFASFIWMGLVFVGLILTMIHLRHGTRLSWLIGANMATLMATLFVCCFVNVAGLIAGHNIAQWRDTGRLDHHYLCSLGEMALPALLEDEAVNAAQHFSHDAPLWDCITYQPITDWREWGFRRTRLDRYLVAMSDI